MIEINKNSEPKSLLEYRLSVNANYADMPKDVKKDVLERLIKEQGCLCAYCMCRIPQKSKDPQKVPQVTIEHIDVQSENDAAMGLNYHNMLAVCSGNRGSRCKDYLTCDAKRGNERLYVNPLKSETLNTIRYKENGEIYSEDPFVNKSLTETLNLNCKATLLPQCREQALRGLQLKVSKDNQNKKASQTYFQNLLNKIKQPNKENCLSPYLGILIYWLSKKISK